MKRFLVLVLVLFLCVSAQGAITISNSAGTVDEASGYPSTLDAGSGKILKLAFKWTSHASAGTLTSTLTFSPPLRGEVIGADFVAGLANAATPTTAYDFVIYSVFPQGEGGDILAGEGANLASPTDEGSGDNATALGTGGGHVPIWTDKLKFMGTNCGNSKKGTIYLYIKQ